MTNEEAERLLSDREYGMDYKFRDVKDERQVYCKSCFVTCGVILIVKLEDFEILKESNLECRCCKALEDYNGSQNSK